MTPKFETVSAGITKRLFLIVYFDQLRRRRR